ncbi:hypothetical protein SAMN02745671_02544 [Anaerovibrio lipolyticus DSM 3074]|uniref:Uncharacterized protein n=1 Tax=Anaerovibrio lipolyticus DSM 3074 TaxID=1120997 RepID=A0A1M6G6U3_9FIRM|nr:hypothetical protein [Anaerovibrio lipolyticus]SHJ05686.1 hypothetical protein SAMN02745671_02544 [Anaerovibrio lipolyticus DSM 3074]
MNFYEQIKNIYFKLDNLIYSQENYIDISSIYSDLTDLFSYPSLSTREAEIVSDLLTMTNQGSIHNLIAYMSDVLDTYQDQDQDDGDSWGYVDNKKDGWGDNYEMA